MSEAQKVEPLSENELACLAFLHQRKPAANGVVCGKRDSSWPCDEIRLLSMYDVERERADAAVELLRWVVDHRGLIWPAERVVEIEAVIGQSPTNHNLCPPRICPRRKTPIDKESSRG